MEDCTRLEFSRSGATTVGFVFEPQVLRCKAAGPGGSPLHVLIDTGTDPSALDARLVRRLGLPLGGCGKGYSASDIVSFTEATLPWMRLGDLTIRNLFAPALDLSVFPFQVDVVLGYNVLRQLVLHIDYAQRQISFLHPELGPRAITGMSRSLPLVFLEYFPALRGIALDGVLLPTAAIDTGSNGAISVGADVARQLGMATPTADVDYSHAVDFGGRRDVVMHTSGLAALGPWMLRDVMVDAHMSVANAPGLAGRVTIGNALLSRFRTVALDYERALLALEPEP